jgi:hypothetical protein
MPELVIRLALVLAMVSSGDTHAGARQAARGGARFRRANDEQWLACAWGLCRPPVVHARGSGNKAGPTATQAVVEKMGKEMTSEVHVSVTERKVEGQFCPYENMMTPCTRPNCLRPSQACTMTYFKETKNCNGKIKNR